MARFGRRKPLSTQFIPSSAGSSTVPNQVSPNTHTQPATAVAPSIFLDQVVTPTEQIAQTAFTVPPAVTLQVVPALVSQPAAAVTPIIGSLVFPALISQPSALIAPVFTLSVAPALRSQLALALPPALSGFLSPQLVTQLVVAITPVITVAGAVVIVTRLDQPVTIVAGTSLLQVAVVAPETLAYPASLHAPGILSPNEIGMELFELLALPWAPAVTLQAFEAGLHLASVAGFTKRLRRVQMHVIVRAMTSNGGPGAELFELTPSILNLVWQKTLNLPGNAAFTLTKDDPKLAELEWMQHHIEIYREDDWSLEKVFAGKVVQPSYGTRDVVILCWDYLAFAARCRVDYYLNAARKRYAARRIGGTDGVIDDLVGRMLAIPDGPLDFVTKGSIQKILGADDQTPIKTGKQFGIADLQDYLTVFFDLAEMSMANTDNTVVFDIDNANRFNFLRDRRSDHKTFSLTFPGTLASYDYEAPYGQVFNDFATLVNDEDAATGKRQITITKDSGPTGIDTIRRLQGAAKIGTLLGFSNDNDNDGAKRLAAQRLAQTNRRVPRSMVLFPKQGYVHGYPTEWDVGHNVQVHIRTDEGHEIDRFLKVHSIAAGWSAEQGERMQLFAREPEQKQ